MGRFSITATCSARCATRPAASTPQRTPTRPRPPRWIDAHFYGWSSPPFLFCGVNDPKSQGGVNREGAFYVWTHEEVTTALKENGWCSDAEAQLFCTLFGVGCVFHV
jgi:hypothetical protein